jgi:hypothetical protein
VQDSTPISLLIGEDNNEKKMNRTGNDQSKQGDSHERDYEHNSSQLSLGRTNPSGRFIPPTYDCGGSVLHLQYGYFVGRGP